MRFLLFVLLLIPSTVFGQMRRKAIVDSFKAATNLREVSSVIANYHEAKVAQIGVFDSGEYVTIMVRIRVSDGAVVPLSPSPPVTLKIPEIVAHRLKTVTVPPLPELIDTIALAAIVPIRIPAATTGRLNPVSLPHLPCFFDARPLAAIGLIRIENIPAEALDTVFVPILPNFEIELLEAIAAAPVVILVIPPFPTIKMDTVSPPVYEEKRTPVMEMHLSERGYSLLEKMEGFSPELYSLKDGGLTIGFGFFIPEGEVSRWDRGITLEAAEKLIRLKVPSYEAQVKRYINADLTQEEFDALTMMAYNLGGFSKATSIVNDINSNADFEQLQKDWLKFVHSKAPGVMNGLMNRRKDELQVRNESNYQPERKLQIIKHRK